MSAIDETQPIEYEEMIGIKQQVADSKPQIARDTKPSAVSGQPSAVSYQPDWPDVLRREWRNTGDDDYAEHLFALIADTPAGREATITNTLLGMGYGGAAGLLLALVGAFGVLPQAWEAAYWPLLAGIGAIAGGAAAWLQRRLFQPDLSTQQWLAQITGNLSPAELGIIGVALIVQLLGGVAGWSFGSLAGGGHTAGMVVLGMTLAVLLGARLVGWLVGFGREPNPKHLHRYRKLWGWWRKRPQGTEVEQALHQACQQHPEKAAFWSDVLAALDKRQQNPDAIRESITHLQSRDWVERFTAVHLLAASGGEGVAQLHPIATSITSPLRVRAVQLLQAIEQETTARLAHRADELLCRRCLAFFGSHSVAVLADPKISYYGCRLCQQSRNFWEGQVVAVLDAHMGRKPVYQNGTTRINWLARRELFDFHVVEIVQASDEDVERFVVQAGNDTDPFRRPRYKSIPCVVRCNLSENSVRILNSMFGDVVSA